MRGGTVNATDSNECFLSSYYRLSSEPNTLFLVTSFNLPWDPLRMDTVSPTTQNLAATSVFVSAAEVLNRILSVT